MKKTILFVILLVSMSTNFSYGEELEIGAESAILIDGRSNRVLLEYNSYLELPMASTTKIMTALLALERGNIEDKIEIDSEMVGVEGSSIYLKKGEIVSLEDLLYGLMLRSGNDSAVAIAKHIGKDVDQFVSQMNLKAKEIGANNTNFTNPHGLSHDNHYTTAYDLALITSEAMKNDKFKEIVGAKAWKADRQDNNVFYNKNDTLWDYEGGDGVKIGYTIKSGRCLVTSATRNNTQLIAVVLNDSDWYNDCYKLMDYGFNNFETYVIFSKGQFIKEIPVTDGEKENAFAVVNDSFLYSLKEEELSRVKFDLDLVKSIKAPVHEGDILGNITAYLDGKVIMREDIVSRDNIEKKGFFKKLIDIIRNT